MCYKYMASCICMSSKPQHNYWRLRTRSSSLEFFFSHNHLPKIILDLWLPAPSAWSIFCVITARYSSDIAWYSTWYMLAHGLITPAGRRWIQIGKSSPRKETHTHPFTVPFQRHYRKACLVPFFWMLNSCDRAQYYFIMTSISSSEFFIIISAITEQWENIMAVQVVGTFPWIARSCHEYYYITGKPTNKSEENVYKNARWRYLTSPLRIHHRDTNTRESEWKKRKSPAREDLQGQPQGRVIC